MNDPKNELSSKVFRMSLAETAVVPGCHEMILPAKFKGAKCNDGVLGIVEPSPGFVEQHDLLLACVVTRPKEDILSTRCLPQLPSTRTPLLVPSVNLKEMHWNQPVATCLTVRTAGR